MRNKKQTNGGGQFTTKMRKAPTIVVDCSEWGQLLEIDVTPASEWTARTQARFVADLLAKVDDLDIAQGGTGFRKIDTETHGRDITLTLAPIEPEQAKARIQKICKALANPNTSSQKTAKIATLNARLG